MPMVQTGINEEGFLPAPAEPAKTNSINAIFIDAFLKASINTLKVQCRYEVSAEKPYILNPEMKLPTEIVGVIGLTSNVFRGTITLCFTEKLYLEVMGSMFGETYSAVRDELSDGAGELLNIIFGTAKSILVNEGFQVEMAIPTVIRGSNIKMNSMPGGNGTTIVVPFSTKSDKLYVLVSLGNFQAKLKQV